MVNINKIKHSYGESFELDVGELDFNAGEITVLLGKNGSGKSTLIKSILGVVEPNVVDMQPNFRDAQIRKRVGVLIEGSDSVFPRLSVWDNAKYLSKLRTGKFNAKLMEQLIGLLGLGEYRNITCQQLSTGNKRKAYIAAVFACDPDYIFLDEPTLGLDLEAIEVLQKFLVNRAREGKTLILTSHDSNFMLDVANKFYLISNGKIADAGSSVSEFEKAFSYIRKSAV